MSAQIIEREGKPEFAVVPYEDYVRLVEETEMLDDIRAYDEAKAELKRGDDELIPWEISVRLIEDENRVRVCREYRGLAQADPSLPPRVAKTRNSAPVGRNS